MTNKKESKSPKRKFRTGRLLLTIFVLVYIPSLIYWFYGNTAGTEIVYMGNIEDAINIDALLVRDEKVLNAPFNGEYIPLIEEGEKVAVNSIIATIFDSSSSKLFDEINQINTKILVAQGKNNKGKEFFNQDIEKLEKEIESNVNSIIGEINSSRFDKLKQIKNEIDSLMQKRMEIIGEDDTEDVYIRTLKEQKEKLTEAIDISMKEIKASSSGIVSYVIDNHEKILTPTATTKLTPEIFENIMSKEAIDENINNRKVTEEKPYGKIIGEFQYWIVLCVKSDSISSFKTGQKVPVRINDINRQIRCTVDFISEEFEDKRQVIVLSADKYLGELTQLRNINIDLIRSSYEGLMVPLRSLRNVNSNIDGGEVVLLKGDIASVRKVKIVGYNNEYAIVESIDRSSNSVNLYDTYIIDPRNIQDGQVIN